MARITIQIDDDIYEAYVKKSSEAKAKHLIAQVAERFVGCTPVDRYLVIEGAEVGALENMLHGGSLHDGRDLVEKVERLANIQIGDIRLNPSIAQMDELARRAERFGRTPQQECERIFSQLSKAFFLGEVQPLPTL